MSNCTGCAYLNKNIKKVCDACRKAEPESKTFWGKPLSVEMRDYLGKAVETLSGVKAKGRHKPGVMNKTESFYAELLKMQQYGGMVLWWQFESITLKLADDTRYTPDFAVLFDDGSFEFHETKHLRKQKDGTKKPHFEDDALAKIKIAAEMFPFTFKSMWQNEQGVWEAREF